MAKKLKKALFGRSVEKFESKTPTYGGGYTRSKTKIVTNKEGDIIKTKNKSTTYTPTGENTGRLSTYAPEKTTVTKRKYDTKGNMTMDNTRSGVIPVKKKGGSVKKKK